MTDEEEDIDICEELDEDEEELDLETESDYDREERLREARDDRRLQEWKDGERPGWNGKYRGER